MSIARTLVRTPARTARGGWRSRHLYHGHVVDPETDARVDDVLLTVMRAPRSYTGQDVVEISGHGGVAVQEILRLAVRSGARPAERGELTLRAFLAGKLDLAQAEAVADTVAARTPAALSLAVAQLGGGLSARVGELRGELIPLAAQLEASVDFDEDEAPPIERDEAAARLRTLLGRMDALLATARWGHLVRDGVRIALVGRPNAGKSSLLNALLEQDRAIVTAIPGTTRDVIEERVDLLGVPAVLADTAGIADSQDPIERLGIERSRRAIDMADLVMLVVDGSAPLTPADDDVASIVREAPGSVVTVINKVDLPALTSAADVYGLVPGAPVAAVSALTGQGLAVLREHLAQTGGWLYSTGRGGQVDGVVTNTRHRDALLRARTALDEGAGALVAGLALDAVCTDVRTALEALGQITGESVTEDVLSEIFSRFCIGK